MFASPSIGDSPNRTSAVLRKARRLLALDFVSLVHSFASGADLAEQTDVAVLVDRSEFACPSDQRLHRHSPACLHRIEVGEARIGWHLVTERGKRREEFSGELICFTFHLWTAATGTMQNDVADLMRHAPSESIARRAHQSRDNRIWLARVVMPPTEGVMLFPDYGQGEHDDAQSLHRENDIRDGLEGMQTSDRANLAAADAASCTFGSGRWTGTELTSWRINSNAS